MGSGSRRVAVSTIRFNGQEYPVSHWADISRFLIGDERDPKNLFRLSDDKWEAWPYAERGCLSRAQSFRVRFGRLRSWIKPYVKRYCYYSLINGKTFTNNCAVLPYRLTRADQYIIDHGISSIDGIASQAVFESLWDSQLRLPNNYDSKHDPLPSSAVSLQEATRPFWKEMYFHFGVPQVIPRVALCKRRTPAEKSADQSKLIPDPVIRQLVNKLALHRSEISLLSRYHHFRLCLLMLIISLGRRVEEVLLAPRGNGPDGPLEYYPCRHIIDARPNALWFRFTPNKNGPSDVVYVSPRWEDIVFYCVRQLVQYGDEVRQFAAPEDQNLLILVSTLNWTGGTRLSKKITLDQELWLKGVEGDLTKLRRRLRKIQAVSLTYGALLWWLNGNANQKRGPKHKRIPGIMEEWNITSDGSANGQIHKLNTHHGRHTRQSALARDPKIPLLVRQSDLNHRDANMQFAYQHVIDEQNETLMAKMMETPLFEQNLGWSKDLAGIDLSDSQPTNQSPYKLGLVTLFTPRLRRLMENNPLYFDSNHVEPGVCGDPQGPKNCIPYQESSKKRTARNISKTTTNHRAKPAREKQQTARSIERDAKTLEPISEGKSKDVVRKLKERRLKIEEDGL